MARIAVDVPDDLVGEIDEAFAERVNQRSGAVTIPSLEVTVGEINKYVRDVLTVHRQRKAIAAYTTQTTLADSIVQAVKE